MLQNEYLMSFSPSIQPRASHLKFYKRGCRGSHVGCIAITELPTELAAELAPRSQISALRVKALQEARP